MKMSTQSQIFTLIQNGIYSTDLKINLKEIKAEFERLRGLEHLEMTTEDLLQQEQKLDEMIAKI